VPVVPERCRHCEQPFPETAARRRARVWRHQVVELLPLAVRVTEYQVIARRTLARYLGRRFRPAALLLVGARLTATTGDSVRRGPERPGPGIQLGVVDVGIEAARNSRP